MAFTFKDSDFATEFGTGTLATDTTINVAVGDLCVVVVTGASAGVFCDALTDTAGNSYTVRTAIIFSFINLVIAWTIATSANASNIFTAGFDDEITSARKNIDALVFTPDGGDTVSFDVTASGGSSFEASPWETGQANTTGTDEVIVCGILGTGGGITTSNHEIPDGTAATVDINDFDLSVFYRIATATISNCEGIEDTTGSAGYAAEFVSFKSVAAAPSGQAFRLRAIEKYFMPIFDNITGKIKQIGQYIRGMIKGKKRVIGGQCARPLSP